MGFVVLVSFVSVFCALTQWLSSAQPVGAGRSKASSSTCGNVPPHPPWTEALAVHSGCSSWTNLTHISSCLLGCYFFIVSFLVTQRTVDFPCPPHSVEFPGGSWSWDDLFGSKCTCFPKQTGFPSQTQCQGEEGLFPRCTELAPPSSKPDKARSVPRGVNWAVSQEVHFKDWL